MDKRIAIFIMVYVALLLANFTHFKYSIYYDNSISPYPSPGLLLSVWNTNCPSGCYSFIQALPEWIISSGLFAMSRLSYYSAYFFNLWLDYSIAGIGMFLLVEYITRKEKRGLSLLAGLIASVIFVSHFSIWIGDQAYMSMFLPFLVLYLLRYIESGNHRDLLLTALFLGGQVSVGNLTYLAQNLGFFVALSTLLILFYRRGKKEILGVSGILGIGMLCSAPIFFNLYLLKMQGWGCYFGAASLKAFGIFGYGILTSLLSFIPTLARQQLPLLINSSGYTATGVGILVLAISLLSIFSKKKIILAFILLFIMVAILGTTTRLPFKIFESALSIIPQLYVLRLPYVALHYLLAFLIAPLFALGVLQIVKTKILVGVLICGMIIVLYISTFAINVPKASVSIPSYVQQTSDYVNQNLSSGFSVGLLPVQGSYTTTTYYYGVNIYPDFIRGPVYTGGFNPYINALFEPASSMAYYNASYDFDTKLGQSQFDTLANSLGIKYLILDEDLIYNQSLFYPLRSDFNYTIIKSNLQKSAFIQVAAFGNEIIYQNQNVGKVNTVRSLAAKWLQSFADITIILGGLGYAFILINLWRCRKAIP